MSIVAALDRALAGRVLVVGSVPPEGRDLDLLVRADEAPTVSGVLTAEGFARRGDEWARFRDCGAEVVEVTPAAEWRLPEDEVARLFDDATPLDGCSSVVVPAAQHAVLVLARRLARSGRLDEKRLARVPRDPDVWARARASAKAWGVAAALDRLWAAVDTGTTPTTGAARARHIVGRLPGVRRARRAPVLVAFSGLDGSGKSSQAEAVREVLHRLGYDPVVQWSRLTFDPGVARIGDPVKRLIARGATGGAPDHDPARALRRRSRIVTHAWTTVLALANVAARRRAVLPHLRAGRAVVCDRYVLDAVVQLRLRYGEGRPFPFQEALLRLLSPRPAAAWFLDVPADVAHARKPDDEELDDARRQADVYRAEHARLAVQRLDGTLARADLCAAVAKTVWERVR